MKNSILVCGAPNLNKKIKIKIIADPIHIVLCNMIIVVKYVLSKRKRERKKKKIYIYIYIHFLYKIEILL